MALANHALIRLLGLAGQHARRRMALFRRTVVGHLHSVAKEAVDDKEIVRAEVSYRLLLRLNPCNAAAIAGLVELYREVGRIDRAVNLERQLIAGRPDDFFRYLDSCHSTSTLTSVQRLTNACERHRVRDQILPFSHL